MLTSREAGSLTPDRLSVIRALERLSELQPGWDGYHAQPIDGACIETAKRLVSNLPEGLVSEPRVVPMTGGRLQLEWHRGPRSLELEFETGTRLHYLRWDPTTQVEDENILSADNPTKVVELLEWFAGLS